MYIKQIIFILFCAPARTRTGNRFLARGVSYPLLYGRIQTEMGQYYCPISIYGGPKSGTFKYVLRWFVVWLDFSRTLPYILITFSFFLVFKRRLQSSAFLFHKNTLRFMINQEKILTKLDIQAPSAGSAPRSHYRVKTHTAPVFSAEAHTG